MATKTISPSIKQVWIYFCWHCGKVAPKKEECCKLICKKSHKRHITKNPQQQTTLWQKSNSKTFSNRFQDVKGSTKNDKMNEKDPSFRETEFLAKITSYKAKLENTQWACTWLVCGANHHFIWNRNALLKYRDIELVPVETCNGSAHNIGEGNMEFNLSVHKIILFC